MKRENITVRFNAPVTGVDCGSDSEDPFVTLSDGGKVSGDVIVGADGVRSAVRGSMFPRRVYTDEAGDRHTVEPTWTGVVAYRTLITRSMLETVQEGGHRALTSPLLVRLLPRIFTFS